MEYLKVVSINKQQFNDTNLQVYDFFFSQILSEIDLYFI